MKQRHLVNRNEEKRSLTNFLQRGKARVTFRVWNLPLIGLGTDATFHDHHGAKLSKAKPKESRIVLVTHKFSHCSLDLLIDFFLQFLLIQLRTRYEFFTRSIFSCSRWLFSGVLGQRCCGRNEVQIIPQTRKKDFLNSLITLKKLDISLLTLILSWFSLVLKTSDSEY